MGCTSMHRGLAALLMLGLSIQAYGDPEPDRSTVTITNNTTTVWRLKYVAAHSTAAALPDQVIQPKTRAEAKQGQDRVQEWLLMDVHNVALCKLRICWKVFHAGRPKPDLDSWIDLIPLSEAYKDTVFKVAVLTSPRSLTIQADQWPPLPPAAAAGATAAAIAQPAGPAKK